MFSLPGQQNRKAFAIISTLLVIAILTVIVVAFMQSMRVDRLTARAYLNKVKADIVVKGAVNDGVKRLLDADLVSTVTAYENLPTVYGGAVVQVPMLTALELNGAGTSVARRRYLASTANLLTPPDANPSTADTMDINTPFGVFDSGFVGLADSASSRKTIPVEWIYLEDADGNIAGRYAFWIDDESAKVNLKNAGVLVNAAGSPPDTSHFRKAGASPGEVSLGLFMDSGNSIKSFLDFRGVDGAALLTTKTALQATNVAFVRDFEDLRSSLTIFSEADERGSLGPRKINLNTYVATATDYATPIGRSEIVANVVALGDFINAVLPDFGNRYYTGNVSAQDKRLYCIKIAGNIQDYIDSDSQPTVIHQNLTNWINPPSSTVIGDGAPTQPPAIFGKEAVPVVGEYVGYYYNGGSGLQIDHAFEVYNVYSKPINASNLGNLQILMAERPDIVPNGSGTDPDLPGEPGNPPLAFSIPNTATFDAGSYTLITTLPASSPYYNQWVAGTPVRVGIPREGTYAYTPGGFRLMGDSLNTSADVDTEVVIANQYGYLDIQARVAQQAGTTGLTLTTTNSQVVATQSFGNDPSSSGANVDRRYPLDSGDPRSLVEVFPAYSESGGSASMIAWRRNSSNSQGATILGGDSNGGTFGIFADNSNTDSTAWVPEPRVNSGTNALSGLAVIRDGSMKTAGELGFIYDPAISGSSSFGGTRQRGGFRTLAIGTRRGEVDGPRQLTQLGASSSVPFTSSRAYRLLDLFTASDERAGLINLNSIKRDGRNLALKSLLDQFKTQANAQADEDYAGPRDPNLTMNQAINAVNLINEIEQQVDAHGPFLSLGQLGDLNIFNTGSGLAGIDLSPANNNANFTDRGREEAFRNLVGLLTLKGTCYTIYAVGQAGELNDSGTFVAKATSRIVQTVRLKRTYSQANPIQNRAMPALLNDNRPAAVNFETLYRLHF